ncbi:hypothetical protein CPB86DRAFT_801601 [Serendipita vermifera]|nr:hypothetical protein CPB86DRAFT_801601 [Serendipita vermifera]
MRLKSPFVSLLSLILLAVSSSASAESFTPWPPRPKVNLTQCMEDVLNHTLAYDPFWIAANGSQTFNRNETVGTDYATCKAYCGTTPSAFRWSDFSPQFTGWLLPFLALTAQLPYESNGTWHDLMSLFLTVGSPQLAMYSLAMTILNSRYVKRRLDEVFSHRSKPQLQLMLDDLKMRIFKTLRVSQQQPFELGRLEAHSSDLDDDSKTELELRWWSMVDETLEWRQRRFTASLATQAGWAIVAFSFTWVDAFGSEKIGNNVTAFGLAIALCWSWLTVLVLGWFFAGVSLSHSPISEAIAQANQALPNGLPRLAALTRLRGSPYSALSRRIAGDAERAGPMYNYAKAFVWAHMADHIIETIRIHVLDGHPVASAYHLHTPLTAENMEMQHIHSQRRESPVPSSEAGTQLTKPGAPTKVAGRYLWADLGTSQWERTVYSRMFWAALSSVILNTATVGSAFWLDFLTPSVGLGCRSGGVLIYWMMSYIVWFLLVASAWLSDRWSVHEATERMGKNRPPRRRVLGTVAVVLRIVGKTLAVLNSFWIVIHCLFEFTAFYTRCFCQTNRRTSPWLFLDEARIREMDNVKERWLGLAILTGSVCAGYIAFMGFWTARRL